MNHKDLPLVDAKAEGDAGQFSALVSTWNDVDREGDRFVAGAFSESLIERRRKGRRLPIVFSHGSSDPEKIIGSAHPDDVRETTTGLRVDGRLDIKENPTARRVFRLLKSGTLREWSIGFLIKKGGSRVRDGIRELTQVDLLEAGPCLAAMNPATDTLAVKALAGRDEVFSSAERQRMDREIEELAAELEAKAARRAKAARPIKIRTFEC